MVANMKQSSATNQLCQYKFRSKVFFGSAKDMGQSGGDESVCNAKLLIAVNGVPLFDTTMLQAGLRTIREGLIYIHRMYLTSLQIKWS